MDLPPLLFTVWGLDRQREVLMYSGGEPRRLVKDGLPEGLRPHWHPTDAPSHALATRVVGGPVTGGRSMQWLADERVVNHYHIAVQVGGAGGAEHPPCAGAVCGHEQPCVGLLAHGLLPYDLAPLPTAYDGDCASDTCLFFDGKRRSPESRLALRS